MEAFAYSNSPWQIRPDLPAAFQYTWQKVAEPGNWLTGGQRVGIAAEVRHARTCTLCQQRKAALSPYAVDGVHDGDHGQLDDVLVDLAHRLTTDASRLTESWVQGLAEQGVTIEAYVEVLSVVVSTLAIDAFHEALGFELEPLPDAVDGSPSEYRPVAARKVHAWVPTVAVGEVSEGDADMYANMPRGANVITAMSVVPDAIRLLRRQSDAMYLQFQDVANPGANGNRALSRPQIELIAGRVSALNDCFY